MQNVDFIISSLYFLITVETLMDVPMHFYQLVYIIVLSAACCSLSERFLGGPPHNLQMESSNFQHILSWQAKSDPALPTYYRVLYTDRRNWKIAKQCSDITQLSCNLTDDFKETFTQYSALVESIIGTEVFNSSLLHFAPLTDTFLGPPEINISSCLNCINVTIKLPTSYYRENEKLLSLIDIYKSLYYVITLKTPDGEHKRPQEETTEEIFNTVIEELYPNRNYCVSVMITASINKHSIPSAWKCVTADSVAEPVADYHTAAVAGAMCVSLMLAGVLKCLHAGGYILQTQALPRALVFIRTLTYSPWTFESEKIASVEIIYKEMKKKANESSGGVSDEDDSDDSESNAISNHDYTRRDILSRVPHFSDTSNVFVPYSTDSTCDDSSSQASENPDANPEDFENHEMDVEEDKDTSSELLNPFSKVNSNCSSRQRESPCFTIDLKTVLLGASEEDVDSSAALLSSQEDAVDWQCARSFEANLDDTENMQKPNCHNDSQEWQNSCHSSNESDSSDSDMEQNTEYIRR
ncbi:interferon alpha/beta receptor 2 [Falco biarmicus]|uniref:interferon alpha/beta receptor 2 n=1 Tax=Falco biarmicus TaxID=345155 RepID=UPI0024BCD5C4|nr:interferon alpha/beta receptor 2 [Falco biarmicus]XP_056184213.1 interferon alpha/beta receptor 2 [Falco biarmicus]XP_056184214.1 interferon alpha/beta receptor 2 [Falco biarmicus]XP_056184215.1 interferon alpha/beta receptor 2 [Falco biarmicus]XP_056184216.1 interferon alpha/beta receptor 2 [Falco biarmicus]